MTNITNEGDDRGPSADDRLLLLLVEDDRHTADLYKLKLELDGYAVEIAADGEEGLRYARELQPDLIFLDLGLPNLDGLSVLERIRQDPTTAKLPVVILSNGIAPEQAERSRELGALELLLKTQAQPAAVSAGVSRWAGSSPREPRL